PRFRWLSVLLAATFAFAPASAAGDPPALADPDTEAARRHLDHGAELYSRREYAEALGEFETANRIKPLPAFDYNIARCLDRLERWAAAADAYERYAASLPAGKEADEVH